MPQLETVISVSPKEGVDVWALNNGTHLRSIQFPAQIGSGCPIVLDEEHIVVPQSDRPVLLVINWKTGQVKTRSSILESIKPMAISNDRQYMVGGAASGKVFIWHVPSGELVRLFDAHYKGVSCLQFSDDDAFLFTGGDDGILNVWIFADLVDAFESNSPSTLRLTPFAEFSNHSLPITHIHCGIGSSGGGKIVTSSLDRTVKIFCLASRSLLSSYSFPAPVSCVVMDAAETFVCAGCSDHNIYKVLLLSQTQADEGSATTSKHSLSSLFANIASVNKDQFSAKSWSASQWGGRDLLPFSGHSKEVTSLSLSLNGSQLCSASLDGTIRVWDTPTRQLVRTMGGNRSSVGCVLVVADVHGALNVRQDSALKRTFPLFTKYLNTALPLMSPVDTVKPGTTRGTLAYCSLPVTKETACLDSAALLCGPSVESYTYSPRIGEGLIGDIYGVQQSNFVVDVTTDTVPSAMSDTQESTQNEQANDNKSKGKKRKHGGKAHETPAPTPALAADKPKSDEKGLSREELEAEVRKWKMTAADLYKKLNKK